MNKLRLAYGTFVCVDFLKGGPTRACRSNVLLQILLDFGTTLFDECAHGAIIQSPILESVGVLDQVGRVARWRGKDVAAQTTHVEVVFNGRAPGKPIGLCSVQ